MVTAITAIRQAQVPLLALILLGACAAKLATRLHRAVARRRYALVPPVPLPGTVVLFPAGLRRVAGPAVCAAELGLGAGLILTAPIHGGLADGTRLATALFFLVATSSLAELRSRRPGSGCGCFGDLSQEPAGYRSITRAALFTFAALACVGVGPLQLPPSGWRAVACLGLLAAELVVLAALSPEVREVLVRLGYSEPCQRRVMPPHRALTALHRSAVWRRHADLVTSDVPADIWRELCWWYVVYRARLRGRELDLVFAVQVKAHRPAVVVGMAGPGAAAGSQQPRADAGRTLYRGV